MTGEGKQSEMAAALEQISLKGDNAFSYKIAAAHCFPDGFPTSSWFETHLRNKAFVDAAMLLTPAEWYASSIIQDRWKPELWFVSLRKPGGYNASAKKNGLAHAYLSAAVAAHDIEAGRSSNEPS